MRYFSYNREKRREAISKAMKEKANRHLRNASFIAIGISIMLMLVKIIWWDAVSGRMFLLIRGFAGLFALISVVLYCIMFYRVNKSALK